MGKEKSTLYNGNRMTSNGNHWEGIRVLIALILRELESFYGLGLDRLDI